MERASQLGYPALGLTDHASPSGWIQLYNSCMKAGVEPLPGMELYVVPDTEYAGRKDSMHLIVNAYNEAGYRNLAHIATTCSKKFWYKPLIDFADFAEMASNEATAGLAVATGCHFGVLPQTLMKRGPKAAKRVAEALAGWFPHVYIELQNHGVDEHNVEGSWPDEEVIEGLYQIAQEVGLPCVITRDSHYVDEADKPYHETLKRMVSWSDDVDDAVFPGGGYHMTDERGMRRYFEPKHFDAGMEGLNELAELAYVRLPELENFSLKIPDVTPNRDPQHVLEEKVTNLLAESAMGADVEYEERIRAEFDVIRRQEMAAYILLVDKVCDFMESKNISYHTRGSATGSLCNFLLGITQLDPIAFDLRFDRFMSSNRLKPPDVDFDIEHGRVDEVAAFLASQWSVCRIGSHMKYSLDEDEDEHGTGSLRARYFSTMKKKGTPIQNWRDISRKDRDELLSISKMGLISGYGRHPAGYIVAPNSELISQLPMAWIASSKKLVTAFGKSDVEKLGFLKLDFLGLRHRTAIKIAEELSGVQFDTIPLNDWATFRDIGRGRNEGLFQLEGGTQNYGSRQVKPKRIDDIIAIQALYRPATMGSNATQDYLDRREDPTKVPVRHPDISETTKDTFGVMLYQEQVMSVLENLGMTTVELEDMLQAVKASNEYSVGAAEVITRLMPRITELAHKRAWTQEDIDWLSKSLESYAEYSFCKAHAASYGVIAYSEGYMRLHHPADFWTGILTAYANHEKELAYVAVVRSRNITVHQPEINSSGVTYKKEGNAIRKGFLSVPGVGVVGANELAAKGPYSSFQDLGRKVLPSKVSGAKMLALGKSPFDQVDENNVKFNECGGIIAALARAGVLNKLEWEPEPTKEETSEPEKKPARKRKSRKAVKED